MSSVWPNLAGAPFPQYGGLISRGNVEAAVLSTLSSPPVSNGEAPLLVYYLAAVERANGLTPRTLIVPPSISSFRGGLDFETYGSDEFPLVIAVVQPNGDPERFGGGEYGQWFSVNVASVVAAETEDDARALADSYGIAVSAALLQHGALGGLSQKTVMAQFPATDFPNPDRRSIARSVLGLHVNVQPVVIERYGPLVYGPDPYTDPGYYPEVKQTSVTVTAEPLD